jgi:hypothetical protein
MCSTFGLSIHDHVTMYSGSVVVGWYFCTTVVYSAAVAGHICFSVLSCGKSTRTTVQRIQNDQIIFAIATRHYRRH